MLDGHNPMYIYLQVNLTEPHHKYTWDDGAQCLYTLLNSMGILTNSLSNLLHCSLILRNWLLSLINTLALFKLYSNWLQYIQGNRI